jgi:hypothetical protein
MWIMRYSDGRGHLVFSIACMVFCLVLVLFQSDATVKGLAISVVTLIVAYWFTGKATGDKEPPTVV